MSDTTAWIPRGWANHNKRYHTDPECHSKHKARNLKETTVEEAERRGIPHCGNCTRDHSSSNYDSSYQEALKRAAQD